MKKLIALALSGLLILSCVGCGSEKSAITEFGGTLSDGDKSAGFLRTTATDDYGRTFIGTQAYNQNLVGVFYFLWLDQAANDVTIESYMAQGKTEQTVTGQTVASAPTFTWWGEPMYGFYQVEDEWVVRKHVELFMNAGLDFICFDATNNDYYRGAAKAVLDVLLEYHELGYDVPKAMFMTNSGSPGMINDIYQAFYRRGTYDAVMFKGNGDKPWIIGSDIREENRDDFYFKPVQWPTWGFDESRFPWISWRYPQETFRDEANGYNIVSVSVTQHTGINGNGVQFSLSGLCSPGIYPTLSDTVKNKISETKATQYYNLNHGRGFSQEAGVNNQSDILKNVNFEDQWKTVHENDNINLVFVTGWNEWIAQKQPNDPMLGAPYDYFCDTFNMEFSRDIEMMNGGYLDNCYLQLVRNIRDFKGIGSTSNDVQTVAGGLDWTDLGVWENAAVYADLVGETIPRNHAGAGSHIYVNETGRNDIVETRVIPTSTEICFLITTKDAITEKEENDTSWMNLWIGVEGAEGGWNGLQYVINRSLDGPKSSLDKITGSAFAPAGECETLYGGNHMLVRVPKSALGIEGDAYGIRFKVTDHLQKEFDLTDLYVNGDCAPIGRISYSFYAK